MEGKPVRRTQQCPQCKETILPEDKFCFHCGRRLQTLSSSLGEPSHRHFPQWPLAIIGGLVIAGAIYVVHHQSQTLARVQSTAAAVPKGSRPHQRTPLVLHPVVTKTTTYPANTPSSSSWTDEVENYHGAQLSLRVPTSMNTSQTISSNQWSWGTPSTPYRVVLGVVSTKPSVASVTLGTGTFGTPISKSGSTATQDLYVLWSNHRWVEVLMTVPSTDSNWLGAIAESVRVS